MIRRTLSIVAATAIAAAACSRSTSLVDIPETRTVALHVGDTARPKDSDVTVTLSSVADSRCPSDVVCVSAGEVVMGLRFARAGAARTDTIYLYKAPRSATYGGYAFTALGVEPYPTTKTPATADRVVTLQALPVAGN